MSKIQRLCNSTSSTSLHLHAGELLVVTHNGVHDPGVGEGGGVADILGAAGRHLPQDPPHDLARPRLGQPGGELHHLGHREPGDLPLDELLELSLDLLHLVLVLVPQKVPSEGS